MKSKTTEGLGLVIKRVFLNEENCTFDKMQHFLIGIKNLIEPNEINDHITKLKINRIKRENKSKKYEHFIKAWFSIHGLYFLKNLHLNDKKRWRESTKSLNLLLENLISKKVYSKNQTNEMKLILIRNSPINPIFHFPNYSQIKIPQSISSENILNFFYEKSENCFLSFSNEQLIESLHYLVIDLMNFIDLSEFKDCLWMKSDKREKAPTIMKVIDLFNFISARISTELLFNKNGMEENLCKIIEFANYSRKLNNFELVNAIISSLTSHPVSRLNSFFLMLPKKTLVIFEELQSLVAPNFNYQTYRAEIQQLTQENMFFVPIFAVILKDIASLDLQPDFITAPTIYKQENQLKIASPRFPVSSASRKLSDLSHSMSIDQRLSNASNKRRHKRNLSHSGGLDTSKSDEIPQNKSITHAFEYTGSNPASAPVAPISHSSPSKAKNLVNLDKVFTFGKLLNPILQLQLNLPSLSLTKFTHSTETITFLCKIIKKPPATEELLLNFSYSIKKPSEATFLLQENEKSISDSLSPSQSLDTLISEEEKEQIMEITANKNVLSWNKLEVFVNLECWGLPMALCESLTNNLIVDGRSLMTFSDFSSTIPQIGYRKLLQRKIRNLENCGGVLSSAKSKSSIPKALSSCSTSVSSAPVPQPHPREALSQSQRPPTTIRFVEVENEEAKIPVSSIPPGVRENVSCWTNDEVNEWLKFNGYEIYKNNFAEIDGNKLMALDGNGLLNLNISLLGHRKGILRALSRLSPNSCSSRCDRLLVRGKSDCNVRGNVIDSLVPARVESRRTSTDMVYK